MKKNIKLYLVGITIIVVLIVICIWPDNRNKNELSEAAQHEWLYNQNNQKAILLYQKAIDKEMYDKVFDTYIHFEIGYQYYRLGDYENSITEFNIAANTDTVFLNNNYYYRKALSTSYERRGEYFYEQKEYEQAKKYLIKSVEIEATNWYSYSILAKIYGVLGNKKLEAKYKDLYEKYYQISIGKSEYSTLDSKQNDFKDWLFSNTAVTEVHFESDWQIWITLEAYKYTSEENVEEIARTIAKWYAQKMSASHAVCTVWRGEEIYAKGSYGY